MLIFPIKRRWFDMIRSGEKKEEYRDKTPYYNARLGDCVDKEIDVLLRNGYGHVCLQKTKAEEKFKEIQISLFEE